MHTGLKIKKEITLLLLRDFGVKNRTWEISLLENRFRMEPEDAKEFSELCERYGIDSDIRLEYPKWFLDKKRDHIMQLLDDMIDCIVEANGIFPVILEECDQRRLWQSMAISKAKAILAELQFLQDILPVDHDKYMHYIRLLDKEINILKGWRKYTNKIKKGIIERQASLS